jgi:hypothetical protein
MACPECFRGSVHEGTPRGKIVKLYGLDTYVSDPAENTIAKGIIVIIPDAFGLPFVNNQLLADHYAEKSDYRVYLPDFMAGKILLETGAGKLGLLVYRLVSTCVDA